MRKSLRFLTFGFIGMMLVAFLSLVKFPEETFKMLSSLKRTIKTALVKEKKAPAYDVVTSASVRIEEVPFSSKNKS